jgi:predicted nucleic acid-binding protein
MVTHGRLSVARRGETEAIIVESLARQLTLVPAPAYAAYEAEARDRIPQDPNDWPIVATALMVNAAIWTSDRDFFGCSVPVWTTQTLLLHLEARRARQSA